MPPTFHESDTSLEKHQKYFTIKYKNVMQDYQDFELQCYSLIFLQISVIYDKIALGKKGW